MSESLISVRTNRSHPSDAKHHAFLRPEAHFQPREEGVSSIREANRFHAKHHSWPSIRRVNLSPRQMWPNVIWFPPERRGDGNGGYHEKGHVRGVK